MLWKLYLIRNEQARFKNSILFFNLIPDKNSDPLVIVKQKKKNPISAYFRIPVKRRKRKIKAQKKHYFSIEIYNICREDNTGFIKS